MNLLVKTSMAWIYGNNVLTSQKKAILLFSSSVKYVMLEIQIHIMLFLFVIRIKVRGASDFISDDWLDFRKKIHTI